MIQILQVRKKDGETFSDLREESQMKALKLLLECEFGFGCTVISIGDTDVSVQTELMGCVDTTALTGPKEEMALIVKAAAYYSHIKDQMFLPEYRKDLAKHVLEMTDGNPRIIALGAGLFVGVSFLRGTLIAMLCEDDVQYLPRMQKLDQPTLMAMFELKFGDKIPMNEILELV
jgi:hypothetical protein